MMGETMYDWVNNLGGFAVLGILVLVIIALAGIFLYIGREFLDWVVDKVTNHKRWCESGTAEFTVWRTGGTSHYTERYIEGWQPVNASGRKLYKDYCTKSDHWFTSYNPDSTYFPYLCATEREAVEIARGPYDQYKSY